MSLRRMVGIVVLVIGATVLAGCAATDDDIACKPITDPTHWPHGRS